MKTLKSLFLLCAGLSFCACSSDNDGQFPEGKGAVTVQIVPPTTRAVTVGDAENGELVHGNITLILTHGGTPNTMEETIYYNAADGKYYYDESYTEACTNLEVVFYNVIAPSKLEAKMNGGVPSYEDVAISGGTPNLQVAPESIPVYGFTETFELTGNKVNDYLEYKATVPLKIPVARLEVNIKGGDLDGFGSVTVLGAYLDNYKPNGKTGPTNYYHPNDQNTESVKHGTGASALYDASEITLVTNGFAPAKVEEKNQYFAYNFYASEGDNIVENPKFKLLLGVTKTTDGPVIPTTQYAIIENFVKKSATTTAVTFENGQIYRIDELVLNDTNIQVDEDGESVEYALTAIVTQASWRLETDVTGEWKQK